VLAWRRASEGSTRAGHGWCRWERQRSGVRLRATRLSPAAAAARRRVRRQAQQKGRTPSTTALWLAAGWLVSTPWAAAAWPWAAVLRLYRARWPVARRLKRMPQLLRRNQLRSTHPTSVAATVRALRVAWALQEGRRSARRAHLPTGTPTTPRAVRRGGFVGRGRETLRQPVQGTWSPTRLRACLPRLRRFLVLPPRRREHQETAGRAWLKGRKIARFDDQPEAA
jgi:hypothetical protein